MVSNQFYESDLVYKRYKLVDEFGDYLRAGNNYSHNTIKNYLSDIRHFFGYMNMYFENDFQTMKISPQIIFQYRQSMISMNTSNITIKRRLTSINRFIEFIPSKGFDEPDLPSHDLQSNQRVSISSQTQSTPMSALINQYANETKASAETRRRITDFLRFSES